MLCINLVAPKLFLVVWLLINKRDIISLQIDLFLDLGLSALLKIVSDSLKDDAGKVDANEARQNVRVDDGGLISDVGDNVVSPEEHEIAGDKDKDLVGRLYYVHEPVFHRLYCECVCGADHLKFNVDQHLEVWVV